MEDYKDYLQTERWKTISRTLKSMAGYRCQRCGAKKQEHELNVHHLTYAHKGEEERHTEDLIVLCEDCHWKEHHPITTQEDDFYERLADCEEEAYDIIHEHKDIDFMCERFTFNKIYDYLKEMSNGNYMLLGCLLRWFDYKADLFDNVRKIGIITKDEDYEKPFDPYTFIPYGMSVHEKEHTGYYFNDFWFTEEMWCGADLAAGGYIKGKIFIGRARIKTIGDFLQLMAYSGFDFSKFIPQQKPTTIFPKLNTSISICKQ